MCKMLFSFNSCTVCLLCMKDFATHLFMMLFVSSPRICQTLMDEDTVPLAPAVVQVGIGCCNCSDDGR